MNNIISYGQLIKQLSLNMGYRETEDYFIYTGDGSYFPTGKKIITVSKSTIEIPDLILPIGTIIDANDIIKYGTGPSERTELVIGQYSSEYRSDIPNFDFVKYYDLQWSYEYLINMKNSKYCISPHGYRPDCYRHWEAMYMGCIPITLKSPWLEGFYDMPILFLESWDELTPELLNDKYDELNNRSREKLDINYWLNKVKEITNE